MNRHSTRLIAAAILAIALLMASVGAVSTTASAQTDVVGAADFRNAPILPAGQYVDRIVSGDTAWYSFVYTNNTPFRFAVSIPGVDQVSSNDLDLNASFVAPTLTTVAGPSTEITGSGVEYPNEHTNVWFLKVTLATTGTEGVEYQVVIDIEGVESTRLEDCSSLSDCSFDEELAALDASTIGAQARLDELQAQELEEYVQLEIENLGGFYDTSEAFRPQAEARLARAEKTMAELCAPALTCNSFPDPGTKTPVVGWLVGFLFLGGGAYVAFGRKKPKAQPQPKRVSSA